MVDRNCHKSLNHGLTLCGARPVYMKPTRNGYGLIGPIPARRMSKEHIKKLIKASPIARDAVSQEPTYAVVTNCTYDGFCYNAGKVVDALKDSVPRIHFDEAWYAYAKFHPIYAERFAMGVSGKIKNMPTIFAVQSTHKMLPALSMASMIHVKKSDRAPEHGTVAGLVEELKRGNAGVIPVLTDHIRGAEVKSVQICFGIGCRRWSFRVDVDTEHPSGVAAVDNHKSELVAEVKLFRAEHSGNASYRIEAGCLCVYEVTADEIAHLRISEAYRENVSGVGALQENALSVQTEKSVNHAEIAEAEAHRFLRRSVLRLKNAGNAVEIRVVEIPEKGGVNIEHEALLRHPCRNLNRVLQRRRGRSGAAFFADGQSDAGVG